MKYPSIIILSSVLALSSMSANAQINEVNDAELSKVSGQLKLDLGLRKLARQVVVNYAKAKARDLVVEAVKGVAIQAISASRP